MYKRYQEDVLDWFKREAGGEGLRTHLSAEERDIVVSFFGIGRRQATLAQIAKRTGLGVMQVFKIKTRAVDRLVAELQNRGS